MPVCKLSKRFCRVMNLTDCLTFHAGALSGPVVSRKSVLTHRLLANSQQLHYPIRQTKGGGVNLGLIGNKNHAHLCVVGCVFALVGDLWLTAIE